jgi:hypothetical protein
MPIYEFYIEDDRYSVPSLHLVAADDVDHALHLAETLLRNSIHHLGVEVCADGEMVFAIGAAGPVGLRDAAPVNRG